MSTKKKHNPSTTAPSTRNRGKPSKASVKGAADAVSEPTPTNKGDSPPSMQKKGTRGVPGSKNPERRCHATVRSTGLQCKRAAIKGGTVCTTHGGLAPQVKRSAKQRLLELLDPALAALYKVLTDPHADDSVKVRAAVAILDRTGHGPGQTVTVQNSAWDQLLQNIAEGGGKVDVDRGSIAPHSRSRETRTEVEDAIDVEWFETADEPDEPDPQESGGKGSDTHPRNGKSDKRPKRSTHETGVGAPEHEQTIGSDGPLGERVFNDTGGSELDPRATHRYGPGPKTKEQRMQEGLQG